MKILDFFLSSVKQGRHIAPLLSCAAMFDKDTSKLGLHFALFRYKQDYISKFTKNPQEY